MSILGLYATTVLIWGSTWIAIKYQLGAVPPELSVAYRFALAAIILGLWAIMSRKRLGYGMRDHGWMALQGLLLFSFNYYLFYLASFELTTGLVALVFATFVVWNTLFSALFFKTPVSLQVLAGVVVGLAGLALVFLPELQAFDISGGGTQALLLASAGTVVASLGNMASVRNQKSGLPVMQTNAFGMAYGAVFSFAFALVNGATFTFDASPSYIGSMLYLAVFGSVLAFGAFLTLLGRIGAGRAAYAMVLFPVVALNISVVFEDYSFTAEALVGAALVLVGNVLVLAKPAHFQSVWAALRRT